MFDTVIKNGLVVDGSGQKAFAADIGLRGGKIAAVERHLPEDCAGQVLDAEGLTIAPGFIDWHSHSDLRVLMGYDGYNVLEQGITLEIAGHCGGSATPYPGFPLASTPLLMQPEQEARILAGDGAFGAYLAEVKAISIPTNMAFFVGLGALRAKVIGLENRPASTGELARMAGYLEEAMAMGAMGFSTGLIYPPQVYAAREEILALARVAARYGGMYTTHMRNEGGDIEAAVAESIALAEEACLPLVISHLKVAGRHNRGKSQAVLRMIDDANARGLTVHFDQYPYDGGSTSLLSVLPTDFAALGRAGMLERLADPAVRRQVRQQMENPPPQRENLLGNAGFDGVLVTSLSRPGINGMTLEQVAEQAGKNPYDAMFDLMIDTGGDARAIFRMISQWDMENILRHPRAMSGIDGWHHAGRDKTVHPRTCATYPRLIGTFCRDKGFMSLELCIHRFTGLAAQAAGLPQKGLVRPGMDADLVVFDYNTIDGKADYNAADMPNTGIRAVFVNGTPAVDHGQVTGARAGRVLLRGR